MLGMIGNDVESVKLFGRRDVSMDANMKALFDESDYYYRPLSWIELWLSSSNATDIGNSGLYYYPYFNDAKELFKGQRAK